MANELDALTCPYCCVSETIQSIVDDSDCMVCSSCGLPEGQWEYWHRLQSVLQCLMDFSFASNPDDRSCGYTIRLSTEYRDTITDLVAKTAKKG